MPDARSDQPKRSAPPAAGFAEAEAPLAGGNNIRSSIAFDTHGTSRFTTAGSAPVPGLAARLWSVVVAVSGGPAQASSVVVSMCPASYRARAPAAAAPAEQQATAHRGSPSSPPWCWHPARESASGDTAP